jgi:hypothetical protein
MINTTMKKIVLFCFLSCLILVLVFHQASLSFLANWSVHLYSVSKWGKPLEYENLQINGNRLVILQPRLKKNGSSFSAERISADIHVDFWNRHVHLDIDIQQPHWHLQPSLPTPSKSWEKLLGKEGKWIKTSPSFRIQRGLLTWAIDDSSRAQQLSFDLEGNSRKGGFIKFYFNPQDLSSDCFALQVLSSDERMEVNCNCQEVSCASLFELAQLCGIDCLPWSVKSGFLQGHLKAIFPHKQRPYLEGEIFANGLAFQLIENPLEGRIEQGRLKLEKNDMAYELNGQVPTFIGQLDILEPASLTYRSPLQEWKINQIEGSIKLNNMETALIDLRAQGLDFDHSIQWHLLGEANLNAQRSFNLDLTLLRSCLGGESNEKIHLSFLQPQKEYKRFEVQLNKVSREECDFLQTFFGAYWPIFNEIELQKGELNGLIEGEFTDQGIGELHIKHFQAFDLCFKLKPWNANCHFAQMRGYGKIYLGKEDFWQSVQAGLHLEDGTIDFEGMTPHLPLTDIQAHLLIQQGLVEHSLITLQLAGLKGTMDVEWGDHKQLLTFKLDGIVQDLEDLLPHGLQEGLRQNFYQNGLIVLANIKRQNQQVELGGTLRIQRKDTDQMDLIHFGCELKKISHEPAPKFVPLGWFYAHHLPLDKFLSPFVFPNQTLRLSGDAECKGSFDDEYLTLKYDAENVKIENEHLCIEINQLHSDIPGQLIGSHVINLKNYSHQGTLPIRQASFYEKNKGLVFQDIQGIANFNNQSILMEPMEAYCEGIHFAGHIELDYSDPLPETFKLTINCPVLSGKVSQIQRLLSCLDQSSLLHKIPLEGDIAAKDEGLKLELSNVSQDYKFLLDIQGVMTDGSLPFESADSSLREICMNFDYDHQQKLLECSDIQGTLLLGKPRRVEEFLLTGQRLCFHQMGKCEIEMDIALKQQENELLRLVGYTKEEKEGIKSFNIDQNLSHISSIYPQVWKCHLKDWSSIEQFEFQSQFNLSTVLQDLSRFRNTGLFFLSHGMIEKISQFLPIEGEGTLDVHYLPNGSYAFQLESSRIVQADSLQHHGLLKGSKRDKKWIIDQLQWDDLHAYAELQETTNGWKIPFLGLNAGQALLLGLEGDFCPVEGRLHAKLNFCEAQLAGLDRWISLRSFTTKWWPKGHLKATGEIEWSCFSSNPWKGLKASLLADIDGLAFRDYPLQVLKPFLMQIQADQKIALQNVRFELPPQNGQAYIDLQSFEYRPNQESFGELQVAFEIPYTQLKMVGKSLHHHFPDILDLAIRDILVESKQQGRLKGKISLEKNNSSENFFRLVLDDGIYRFKKLTCDLKEFELQFSGNKLQFSTFTQYERCPFQVFCQMEWPSCQQGEFTLLHSETLPISNRPLSVKWENRPDRGWFMTSIQGDFSGSSFQLHEDKEAKLNDNWTALQGQVIIDFNRLCPLFTPQTVEMIKKLKIGSSYSLFGNFWLNPDLGNTFLEIVSFKGSLRGQETILKGYQVKNLQGDLQYTPGRLDIQNFSIQDPAGEASAANIIAVLDQKKDRWTLFVPQLTVKNFRLSLLKDTESPYNQTNSKFRSLIVKRIDFQNFSGELNKQQTWQAEGNLHFFNPSRKNFYHPLLAIPAEIILRLGLDPQVLNPVTGIIYFNLRGDRCYLTRFKDMFSEGRGSKFYLAQGPDPSWIDFNGNLSLLVRMKQYNLIFKIAELFTVSIQGNVKKPSYTLQKQSKASHKIPPLSAISKS